MRLTAQALEDAGFSHHQAVVYDYLIKHGPSLASTVARHTHIARTLMYRVLDELIALELVSRTDEQGAVARYTPAHPVKLHEYAEHQKQAAEHTAAAIGSVVDTLTGEYNKSLGRPGVVFFEGTEGVRRVYDDTIANNKSKRLQVLRSHLDSQTLGTAFYREYAQRRVRNNIFTEIISPTPTHDPRTTKDTGLHKIRRSMRDWRVPAEIDIYDDKVAIVAFDEPLIGTIIEKKAVADTMRALFSYVWETLDGPSSDATRTD